MPCTQPVRSHPPHSVPVCLSLPESVRARSNQSKFVRIRERGRPILSEGVCNAAEDIQVGTYAYEQSATQRHFAEKLHECNPLSMDSPALHCGMELCMYQIVVRRRMEYVRVDPCSCHRFTPVARFAHP